MSDSLLPSITLQGDRGHSGKWSGIYGAPVSLLCPALVVKVQQDILPDKILLQKYTTNLKKDALL